MCGCASWEVEDWRHWSCVDLEPLSRVRPRWGCHIDQVNDCRISVVFGPVAPVAVDFLFVNMSEAELDHRCKLKSPMAPLRY